jgi:hypothetical protein
LLDRLAGRDDADHHAAVLDNGQYYEAAEAICEDLLCRNGAQFFWMRQTDVLSDMPPLPSDADPETIIAALVMYSVDIPYDTYAQALPAANAQRKAAADDRLNS